MFLPQRDILSLIAGDSVTSSPSHILSHSVKPTRFPLTPSVEPPTRSSVAQWTPTFSTHSDPPGPTTTATVTWPPSFSPASAESRTTDDSNKTWEIVGVVIIAVLFVAASVTFALFFDRLWGFVKDVTCCTSRSATAEEFVPDCEKQGCHMTTRSPSLSDRHHPKAETLHSTPTRSRELPWNTRDWNTLHRHPSRRSDHTPPV